MNAPTGAPVRKVVAATLGAAIATLILWVAGDVAGLPINEAVSAAIVTIVVFVVGYLVPASASDVPHDALATPAPINADDQQGDAVL